MNIRMYRDEEQLFTFEASSFLDNYPDDSTSLDGIHSLTKNEFFNYFDGINSSANELFDWNTETEQVINGDIAVIPVSGNSCEIINNLSISPPSKGEFQKSSSVNELFDWNPETEQVINGDIAVIPVSGNSCEIINTLSISSPSKDDFQKSMGFHSWQTLSDSPEFLPEEEDILKQQDTSCLQEVLDLPDLTDSKFDLTTYVCGEDEQKVTAIPQTSTRKIKAGVKKIDLQAQKYIVEGHVNNEDDDVDIETVYEGTPILEAGDLNSLLAQFESTDMSVMPQNILENNMSTDLGIFNIKLEPPDAYLQNNHECVDVHEIGKNTVELKITESGMDYLKEQEIIEKQPKQERTVLLKKEVQEKTKNEDQTSLKKLKSKSTWKPQKPFPTPQKCTSNSTASQETTSKQQILNSLPQELINRIKESGKRKAITVIPPIPTNNKKRNKNQDEASKKFVKLGNSDTVNLDHSYCSSPCQNSKKDSGFESSEDDDREKRDKTVISQQPVVKNADGKLMVSLLKVNTIHNMDVANNQKKKLNLEEYKKRRKGFLTPSNNSSQNSSPGISSCTSPLLEDEQLKVIKHQEKLRKMAEEVLNAAPKSDKKPDGTNNAKALPSFVNIVSSPITPSNSSGIPQSVSSPAVIHHITSPVTLPLPLSTTTNVSASNFVPLPVPLPTETTAVNVAASPNSSVPQIIPKLPPPNIETKVLVSFGTNTDYKSSKNKDPLSTVEKLEEIKPLLKKVSQKINNSSLITSLIENIPKVIDGSIKASKEQVIDDKYEHGENKQVLHLEKDRVRVKTVSVSTQTNISLIEQSRRGRVRRRISSSGSSCASNRSSKKDSRSRKSSDSSSTSSMSSRCSRSCSSTRSSNYSSRLSCYSRSRSRSPRYERRRGSIDKDHASAVEERRIIYVGRISNATSKDDLRRKFQKFGPISNVSLHFREHGYSDLENYGFVTFKYKEDAHEAYEHGNDDPSHPYFKISFGGRREFCKTSYSDLDNVRDDEYFLPKSSENSFDALLREVQEKLRKRKA